ncbi:MAG: DUF2442 domain-containing protein [Myxococcales bacterium]|nr:DUF2442 domain-containing protein [Myxococcales bacterium]
MATSVSRQSPALATHVRVDDERLVVTLADGREVSAPLEWFPRLRDGSPEQRSAWRLIGGGIGIRWEALDEDVSVAGLLEP